MVAAAFVTACRLPSTTAPSNVHVRVFESTYLRVFPLVSLDTLGLTDFNRERCFLIEGLSLRSGCPRHASTNERTGEASSPKSRPYVLVRASPLAGISGAGIGLVNVTEAAYLGSDVGVMKLGRAFYNGKYGLPRDPARAKFWLKKIVERECKYKHLSKAGNELAARWLRRMEMMGRDGV